MKLSKEEIKVIESQTEAIIKKDGDYSVWAVSKIFNLCDTIKALDIEIKEIKEIKEIEKLRDFKYFKYVYLKNKALCTSIEALANQYEAQGKISEAQEVRRLVNAPD